jgi:hypothetical protein
MATQPGSGWHEGRIVSWSHDIGLMGVIHSLGLWHGVLAFGFGLVLGMSFDTVPAVAPVAEDAAPRGVRVAAPRGRPAAPPVASDGRTADGRTVDGRTVDGRRGDGRTADEPVTAERQAVPAGNGRTGLGRLRRRDRVAAGDSVPADQTPDTTN